MKQKMNNLNKKIGSLRLTKKEKYLLIILALVIVFWLFNKLALEPQTEVLADLYIEKDLNNEELSKIEEILSRGEEIEKEWVKLNNGFNNIKKKYISSINQPEIMDMINNIIDNNKILIPSINFNEPDYADLNGIETKYLSIYMPFEGKFNDLEKFLEDIRNAPKKILIDQLALSNSEDGILTGDITLKVYSYETLLDVTTDSQYVAEVQKVIKEDPFVPYDDYIVEMEENSSNENIEIELNNRIVIEDFEGDEIYFMPTSLDVTGKVSKFNESKFGKYSLRMEYFLYTEDKEERAYVVLDDKNLLLNYPPSSIGVWAHSYSYSPVKIGFRYIDQEGNKIYQELSRGVNWVGWNYIGATPPQDIELYPLKLDRIYLELAENREDYGVILFDNIEVDYPNIEDVEELDNEKYSFYIVQYGDTFESISEKFYGNSAQYKFIMNKNGFSSNDELELGQILVIPNQ